MTIFSLDAQVEVLLNKVKEKVTENQAGLYSFVPELIRETEAERANLMVGVEAMESREEKALLPLSRKLAGFVEIVQGAWQSNVGGDMPEWMSPAQYMNDGDFYAQFWAGFDSADAGFVSHVTEHTLADVAGTRDAYGEWSALRGKDGGSELTLRKNRAVDLKALLGGVLRVYRMPMIEVEILLRGVVAG